MSEKYANLASAVVSGTGYTAGSGILNVSSTASPFPPSGTFRVAVADQATFIVKVLLEVTAINSGTQWAVTAESADTNCSVGDLVYSVLTAGALDQIKADILAAAGSGILTAKGDLLTFGSAVSRLPVGTNGQVLAADSTQALGIKWAAASGGGGVTSVAGLTGAIPGGMVLLEQHTASTSASVDFTTRNTSGQSGATFQTDYDTYFVTISNLLPVTSGANLLGEASTNGGTSWDTTSGHYAYSMYAVASNGAGGGGSDSATSLALTTTALIGGISNTAARGLTATLLLSALPSQNPILAGTIALWDGQGHWLTQQWSGTYFSTTAMTALRFILDTGNIASGTIRIYGCAKQ